MKWFKLLYFGLAVLIIVVPILAQQGEAPDPYKIRRGDKLSLKFFAHPELNESDLVVRPDGFISPQIIDEVKAEGRTVAELKQILVKSYSEVLLDPIVTVSVVEFVAPRVFILGEVNKPGSYTVRDAETLAAAIAVAGGFTRDAHRAMVVHARPDGRGGWHIQSASVPKILSKDGAGRDIVLKDGDHIFVPESKTSKFNKAVEAFRGLVPFYF